MSRIRKVKEKDISDILDIELRSLGGMWKKENIDFDKERLLKYLREFFDIDRMILIEDEGDILGFLHSRTYEDTVSGKKIRDILTITIHPDHYGEGLGRELMEYERKDAKESKIDILKLEVLSSNERAIEFYKKQGFDEKKKIMTEEISKEK